MIDLEKKILNIASAHSGYDEHLAIQELQQLNAADSDLLKNLFALYSKSQKERKRGRRNTLNSWLSYYLGITIQKPTESLKLEKRRTYGRDGFPDIDMDFDVWERYKIINYLIDKYGREHVASIGTIPTFQVKASLRYAIKVLDPTNSVRFDSDGRRIKDDSGQKSQNFMFENEILSSLPKNMKRRDGTFVETVQEACDEYPDFKHCMDMYPEIKRIASRLTGTLRGFGKHAGGVVLSPVPLSQICPLHVTTARNDQDELEKVITTQFVMEDVERMGLIKLDILGLAEKTAVSWACKLIKEERGVEIDWDKEPLDDQQTLSLLNSGRTDGCFQLETDGMKNCLRMIGIDAFDDLVVAVAMYRPGPKDYIPEFAKRKRGKTAVSYPHPLLKNITEKTYSIICYQEQVMQVFMALAGLTASDGYRFMKGCAKKKIDVIEAYRDKFVKGALSQDIKESVVNRIWLDLHKFSGYAFNKSHSVSYAYESYKTAFLKAHYITEFFCARLSVETRRRKFEYVEKYEQDACGRFGFKMLDPTLNESKLDWSIVDKKVLRRPLLVKNLGIKAAEEIVRHQPYRGNDILYSFAMKVGKAVNKGVMEAMKDAGFWTGISKERLIRGFEQIRTDRKKMRGRPTDDMFG